LLFGLFYLGEWCPCSNRRRQFTSIYGTFEEISCIIYGI